MSDLKEGRHVTANLTGPAPTTGPNGHPLIVIDHRLTLDYRGPLPELLSWLAKQPVDDLRVEPMGLSEIYRKHHGNGTMA